MPAGKRANDESTLSEQSAASLSAAGTTDKGVPVNHYTAQQIRED